MSDNLVRGLFHPDPMRDSTLLIPRVPIAFVALQLDRVVFQTITGRSFCVIVRADGQPEIHAMAS